MTGGSYRTTCEGCGDEIRASARFCPTCSDRQPWFTDDSEGTLVEVFRRATITEAADGGLQVGDRETVDEIDDVCTTLEALRDEVDNPDVRAAISSAIGSAWQASVLQRVDENSDIRMVTDSGPAGVTVRGPDPIAYEQKRGETDGC